MIKTILNLFIIFSLAGCVSYKSTFQYVNEDRVLISSLEELDKVKSAWKEQEISEYTLEISVGWVIARDVEVTVKGDSVHGKSRSRERRHWISLSQDEALDYSVDHLLQLAADNFGKKQYQFYTNSQRSLLLGYKYEGAEGYEDDWASVFIKTMRIK